VNINDNEKFQLKGPTLQVYLAILMKGSQGAGVRSIQRELGMSSPNQVSYHLSKLMSLGIVDKNEEGNYKVKEKIEIDLAGFVIFFGKLIPKYFLYAIFFSTMLIAYLIVNPYRGIISLDSIMVLIFGISASIISWLEAANLWRKRPF